MWHALLSRFFPDAAHGSAALSFEGVAPGWALLCLAALGAAVIRAYGWGAPDLSRNRRLALAALRILLLALFAALLTKPVLLLTLNENVRGRLAVLVDNTQSMNIADRRAAPDDLKRAAIAFGALPPEGGKEAPSGDAKWKNASRAGILQALAANDRLKLWPRLQEKSDVVVYGAAREASPLGPLAPEPGAPVTTAEAAAFFQRLKFSGNTTALGNSLRAVLEDNRGQPLAGVLVLTDGANNSGIAPEEIAQMAKEDGIPLYLYGMGITEPKDIALRELSGPRGAFLKERAEFAVKVRAPGFNGTPAKLRLKVNGKVADEKEILLNKAETEYQLGFSPEEKGECKVEAEIEPMEEETSRDNNTASTKIRVLDSKVKVLYVEQEPRWDFRYLLSTFQRDRRLDVKCVLLDGDPGIEAGKDSPYLKDFPQERAEIVANEIIVLGDVDPARLGPARMKLINEWVGELGGGIIFLAGPKHNPVQYAGTPLEPLLPVELAPAADMEKWGASSRVPMRLKLTPAGEMSPLLRLADSALANREIWNGFPGVRWTAQVAKARPTGQVFLVDTTPEHASGEEQMPVIAQQPYGKGMVMYFGFQETYRWRSAVGEKHYIRIWNQIIQSFSLERQLGTSARIQLKTGKPEYTAGDKVLITGKVYSDNFTPLIEPSIPGTLTVRSADGREEKSSLRLLAAPDSSGGYQAEFAAATPGEYSFSTLMDANAQVKFEVAVPQAEFAETAMNAPLLQKLAAISGGRFLREEDLNKLPELISANTATLVSFKKYELFYSLGWMAALIAVAAGEWFLRRLWQLK